MTNMFGFGAQELIVILVIILVLFGGKKLPELSRSVAEAVREIRKGFSDDGAPTTPAKKLKKKNE